MATANPSLQDPRQAPTRQYRARVLGALCVAGFSAGYLLFSAWATGDVNRPDKEALSSALPKDADDLLPPAAYLSPERVVAIQMKALADYRRDRTSIQQVYALASPANKAAMGPLDNFERMVLSPSYSEMVTGDSWMAGRAVEKEGVATVVVSVVDSEGRTSLYRFFLSRQDAPHEGCWMTDGVVNLLRGWRPGAAAPGEEEQATPPVPADRTGKVQGASQVSLAR